MKGYEIKYVIVDECEYVHRLDIPQGCFVDVAGDAGTDKYEIFYNGKKVNDVYAIVRYGHEQLNVNKEYNWKNIMEGE